MRNNRSTVTNRNSYTVWMAGFVLLVLVITSAILFGAIRTEAAPSEETYKYYTSVAIEAGDTIWSIAQEYQTPECGDLTDYIEEICSLNHITDDQIHTGQYLTIPYYSTEQK